MRKFALHMSTPLVDNAPMWAGGVDTLMLWSRRLSNRVVQVYSFYYVNSLSKDL